MVGKSLGVIYLLSGGFKDVFHRAGSTALSVLCLLHVTPDPPVPTNI